MKLVSGARCSKFLRNAAANGLDARVRSFLRRHTVDTNRKPYRRDRGGTIVLNNVVCSSASWAIFPGRNGKTRNGQWIAEPVWYSRLQLPWGKYVSLFFSLPSALLLLEELLRIMLAIKIYKLVISPGVSLVLRVCRYFDTNVIKKTSANLYLTFWQFLVLISFVKDWSY